MSEPHPRTLLELYLLGELDERDARRVEAWLAEEPGRRAELEAARRTLASLDAGLAPPAAHVRALARRTDAALRGGRVGGGRLFPRWRPLLAAAAVAALAVLSWALFGPREGPPEARQALPPPYPAPEVQGEITVRRGEGVQRGSVLEARGQGATLALGGYCRVAMEQASVVRLAGQPGDERIVLERGRVVCDVQPGGGTFAVQTALCTVSVKGTRFVVHLYGGEGGEPMSRKHVLVKVLTGVVLLTVGARQEELWAGEQKVVPGGPAPQPGLGGLPQAVRQAILDEAKGGRIEGFRAVYEVELAGDRRIRVEVGPNGEIEEMEVDVSLDDVPPAPKEAILRATGEAEIEELRKITDGGRTRYKVEFRGGRGEGELVVDAAGRIRSLERQVALEEVPPAVRAFIEREAGGAKPAQVKEEIDEEGEAEYQVTFADGSEMEIELDAAGQIDEVELSLDRVPAAVRQTILREAQGAKVEDVEREVDAGQVVYEAEFEAGGREVEIRIAPDGTLLEKEVEEDDDGDDDEAPRPPKPADF
ncbi:MAG: PepSY-like domain-containing protein [bacterium]